MAGTMFSTIYNRFLEIVTDDMYVVYTMEDTVKDLQNMLIHSIPGFEFPRKNLYNYTISTEKIKEDLVIPEDFVIGVVWNEIPEEEIPEVIVERSSFAEELTQEEINILALIMKQTWVQRQTASIEVTRMKYSGTDFKLSSQANQLSKLLDLLEESRREAFHAQRLYKRRKTSSEDGSYKSNWSVLRTSNFVE